MLVKQREVEKPVSSEKTQKVVELESENSAGIWKVKTSFLLGRTLLEISILLNIESSMYS